MPEINRKQAARYDNVSCSHIKEMRMESMSEVGFVKENLCFVKRYCIDIAQNLF